MRVFHVSLLVLAGTSIAFAQQPAKYGNEKAITEARLRTHLEFIASDALEGRDTPSRGLDIATMYVAAQLKLWGAKPAGDNGTFFQRVAMTTNRLDPGRSTVELSGKPFAYGEGYKAANKGATLRGKLVYVGHGIMIKNKNIDPYKGVDVKGKILVAVGGLPKGSNNEVWQGTAGVDYMWPELAAQRLGAIGVVTIPEKDYLANWNSEDAKSMGGVTLGSGTGDDGSIPTIIAGPELVKAIFEGEKVTADQAMSGVEAPETSFDLSESKNLNLNISAVRNVRGANNVVAIVPGSDPKLKSEYVAIGAHIDHVGLAPSGTDRIFNGADDDGSGTVAVLEIAHAFLTGPKPKRSILFVWHIGEEKGLWGSDYFTNHPTVDLKNVITQLNIDMIGRSKKPGDTNPANKDLSGPDSIYVIGTTMMSTDLQKVSERVNNDFLKVKFDYKYDDPKDPERFFFRSDHYNYARKGIPILFYFNGVHEDYHQVGDEISKIDFRKISRVARTVYATGWALANGAKRPVVDKPLKQ